MPLHLLEHGEASDTRRMRGVNPKRVPSCIPCRERHLKCSKERPECSNCHKSKYSRRCQYEIHRPLRFRPSKFTDSVATQATPSPPGSIGLHEQRLPGFAEDHTQHSNDIGPAQSILHASLAASDQRTSNESPQLGRGITFLLQESRGARYVSDKTECEVFTFYADQLGSWLDIGSPNHYFQSQITQLAMNEPLLYRACLACSSQVMVLREEVEQSVEELFISEALELLIPLLSSDQSTSENGVLLATTVILRMSEQFMDAGSDFQRHLNGAASLFTNGRSWSLHETDLSTASFWTYLRETIRVCFLHESQCQIPLHALISEDPDGLQPAAPEEAWTNRMTYLLLQIINLCWGSLASEFSYDSLWEQIIAWRSDIPASFRPWCFSVDDASPFPRIQCFESWHVVAWQFYYVARVMLSVYREQLHSTSSLHQLRCRIEHDIVTPTRLLCGICISSTANAGTTFNGSHLMSWCGQFLYVRQEQEHLAHFLQQFSKKTKWPTQSSLFKLMHQWEEHQVSLADQRDL